MSTPSHSVPLWRQMRERGFGPDDILAYFHVIAPPVDVFAIARTMGVQLYEAADVDWAGQIDSDSTTAICTVRAADPLVRKRFTVAHELGHLMMHRLGRRHRDLNLRAGRDLEERQANAFAADLLMPSWLLGPMTEQFGGDVPRLASIFHVSQDAMMYRLTNLLHGYR